MEDPEIPSRSRAPSRGRHAELLVAEHFAKAGWQVSRRADRLDSSRPNMIVRRGGVSYAVDIKAAPEGRSDRLIPLWAQACLQASRAGGDKHPPLAVVAAPKIVPRVAEQVLKYAAEYASDAAVGVIDFEGLRLFRGPHLEGLDSDEPKIASIARSVGSEAPDLFSDLNQWMLKVLLAPEVPEKLLSAPRGHYRNASQLARVANVSVMSAFRLLQQLQREGYLHESAPYFNLVRREDLFRRWQASAARRVKEAPMRFLLRGDPQVQLRRMLRSGRACLGLFAAAEALHFGFVHGVPPHVYVQRLGPTSVEAWKSIVLAERDEVPDLILRQAPAPQSIFRGLVRANGVPVSDVLQIWLDVSSHPARGKEQAEVIRYKILNPLIKGKRIHG